MIQFQQPLTDIFFDLDHTLWDFEKNSKLTYKKICEEDKKDTDLEEFLSYYNQMKHA